MDITLKKEYKDKYIKIRLALKSEKEIRRNSEMTSLGFSLV